MSVTVIIRPFFLRTHIHTTILGRFWHHILDMCPITREPVLTSRRECNSKHCKLFRECFYWQNNKPENVACLFVMYEQGQFPLWGTLRDKIYKMYDKNLCTKDNLREKEVKRIPSPVSSILLAELWCEWIMNILDDVMGLEAEGYLQLNTDKSTDTWAPKLPQQCMARWHGWSSFNPGWGSAMFWRMDHSHCLTLLGDLWYSMRLVSGNCCVMFPREYRRMFD